MAQYTRSYNWVNDRDAAVNITASRMDTEMDGMVTAINTRLDADGSKTPTANQPMGGFKHTGVADATARTDYAAAGQIQDGDFIWCGTATGTADAIVLTPAPAITAYAAGNIFRFISSGANTGATTVAVSGLAAKAITKNGATALAAGDIASGAVVNIVYDGTRFQMVGVVGQPLDGELTAIAGLVSAADRLPYFTGSATAAMATLTSAGRALIDDADAAAQRTTLGLGALATASSVNQGTIDNSAIGQGELKSTTGSQSTAIGAGAGGSIILTGGTYSWWVGAGTGTGFPFGGSTGAAGRVDVVNSDAGIQTFYVNERYVQASPPYTKEFYAYVGIDGSGNILHVSVAPDPIWAYNGPTSIRTEYRRDGKAYRNERTINGVPYKTAIRNPAILRRYLSGELACDLTEVELTPEYKDSDMEIVPHPFLGNNLSGVTVVLLHGPMLSRFVDMCNAEDAAEVRDIVSRYLTIDNTPNGARGQPSVVLPVNCRWKLT